MNPDARNLSINDVITELIIVIKITIILPISGSLCGLRCVREGSKEMIGTRYASERSDSIDPFSDAAVGARYGTRYIY